MTKRQNIYFIYVHLIGNQINWILCLFLQYSLKVKKQFEMTFIDFKKAFDSIHRGKMMRILKAYGIPPNLLQAIEKMYTNTKAKVISPDGETEMFDITTGVLQGDTLAPFLFIIVLHYAMRKAMAGKEEELGFTITPRRSRRHPKDVLADLDFADDIALLSDEIAQA